jgi:hypothetical protein
MNKLELAGLGLAVAFWLYSKFGDKLKGLIPTNINPFKSQPTDALLDATNKWKSLYDQLKANPEGRETLKLLWPQLMNEIVKEDTNEVK